MATILPLPGHLSQTLLRPIHGSFLSLTQACLIPTIPTPSWKAPPVDTTGLRASGPIRVHGLRVLRPVAPPRHTLGVHSYFVS